MFTTDPEAAKASEYRNEARAQYSTPENVARVGYEAVRAIERTFGSDPGPWESLSVGKQADYIAGVNYIFDHASAPVDAQHAAWLARNAHRLAQNDPRRQPWESLDYGQQLKAVIWRHICHAFAR